MKLTVLHPAHFRKSHIDRLRKIGRVSIFKDLPDSNEEILSRIKDAEIIITSSVNIGKDIIDKCRSLRMISLACSGYNRIDIKACNKAGIIVTNAPDYSTEAVSEHVFALLLSLIKKIRETDRLVRQGIFDRRAFKLSQLKGKIFGIIGTGRIGSRVAKLANCFGCKVIANTLHPSLKRTKEIGVKYVKLPFLLKNSDIISLHIPLNSSTADLIGRKEFDCMKKRPILINTSRGKIINHDALVRALSKKLISGAGLDVLPYEPPAKGDALLKFPNVVFSPHNAFCTPEAINSCADIVVENIESFIKGLPKNKVTA